MMTVRLIWQARVGLLALAVILMLQAMIQHGVFGDGMRYSSELFWGINRCH